MDILLLKGFNNYFNRTHRHFTYSIANYKTQSSSYVQYTNINFNPNDGVDTELIIGSPTQQESSAPLNWENNGAPDYCVCYQSEGTPAQNVIKHRWFVLECQRTRNGQYKLTLRRDVITDNYDVIVNSPAFIEKAVITEDSPLLFNKENIKVNQIKQSETLLKDETGTGWVVGYIPYDAFENETVIEKKVNVSAVANITVAGISNWAYWKNCTSNPSYKYLGSTTGNTRVDFKIKSTEATAAGTTATIHCKSYYAGFETGTNNCFVSIQNSANFNPVGGSYPSWYTNWCALQQGFAANSTDTLTTSHVQTMTTNIRNNATFKGYLQSLIGGDIEIGDTSGIVALKDKILYDSTANKYYQIKLKSITSNSPVTVTTSTTTGQNIINFMNSNYTRSIAGGSLTGNTASGEITVQLASASYAVELEQVSIDAFVKIDDNRLHLEDSPYDMFCIPYSDTLQLYDGATTFTCVKNVALGMASAIAEKSGSANVFDVQLLPYCPARAVVAGSANPASTLDLTKGKFDIVYKASGNAYTALSPNPNSSDSFNSALTQYETLYYYDSGSQSYFKATYWTSGTQYYYKSPSGTTKLSALIWCDVSNFQVLINESIAAPANEFEKKISNECDLYRLCSGNYNGVFEFSPAKSDGVTGFIADCTYKPYNPYIHVIPALKGLYGENFVDIDDARGLICGGDFSLPQLSSAWANYELSNKNYQKVFDRQIQNMDVNNSIAQQEAK